MSQPLAIVLMSRHTTRAGTTYYNVTGKAADGAPVPLDVDRQNAIRDVLLTAPAGATASTATWDRGPVSIPAQRVSLEAIS